MRETFSSMEAFESWTLFRDDDKTPSEHLSLRFVSENAVHEAALVTEMKMRRVAFAGGPRQFSCRKTGH